MQAVLLVSLLLAAPPGRPQAQEVLELPPGPARDAADRIAAEELPAPEPGGAPWPDWEAAAWDSADPWRRWGELLGRPANDAVRAELASAALAQGRFDDAWAHFAALEDPALLARLLPRLLPGTPAGASVAPGGRPGPLSPGTLLAPALPPPSAGGPDGRAREMRSAPFSVGEARLDLRVLFEPGSGVQVDLRHLGGPTVALELRLPVPPEITLEGVYLDWDRLEEPLARVAFTLGPETPEVSVWGAHVLHRGGFSRTLPSALPAGFARAGVRVGAGAGPRTVRFAAVLARVLAVPLTDAEAPRPTLHPLELGPLPPGELRALVSAAERFLLSRSAERAGGGEKQAESSPPR